VNIHNHLCRKCAASDENSQLSAPPTAHDAVDLSHEPQKDDLFIYYRAISTFQTISGKKLIASAKEVYCFKIVCLFVCLFVCECESQY